jgi:choline-glycine betaine transporter
VHLAYVEVVTLAAVSFQATSAQLKNEAAWLGSCREAGMNWLVWLGLAVVVAAIAAVTGIKPKGTRPVAHSRMMGVGRIALLVIVAIFAYLAYRARGG